MTRSPDNELGRRDFLRFALLFAGSVGTAAVTGGCSSDKLKEFGEALGQLDTSMNLLAASCEVS